MNRKERIIARAQRAAQAGKAGDWVRLHLLAGELATMREGPSRHVAEG